MLTGANGVADTPDPAGGDDVRILLVGHSEPNTAVILCSPNHLAETTANNVHAGGDDVQRVGVGASCPGAGTVVVDSGANGIAETRAQGAAPARQPAPLTLLVGRRGTASRTVKLAVFNEEFCGPPSRAYALSVSDGSCLDGTVTQVDADTRTPGLQPTANVLAGRARQGELRGDPRARRRDVGVAEDPLPLCGGGRGRRRGHGARARRRGEPSEQRGERRAGRSGPEDLQP